MDKNELIARLELPVKSQMVVSLTAIIKKYDLNIDDLLEISFHKKKEIAFRAAWILEYLMVNDPANFSKHVTKLLALLPDQKNPSAMRHYTKIIALLTDRKADPIYKELRKNINFEPVIETLFTWLIDQQMLVATKVHCMQALANLSPSYQWITEDLQATINHLMDVESIAFFARAKMVKRQLSRV